MFPAHSMRRCHSDSDSINLSRHRFDLSSVYPEHGVPPQERSISANLGSLTPNTSPFPSRSGIVRRMAASALVPQFTQVQGKIARLRHKVLQTRSKLEFEQQRLRDKRRFQYRSMTEFMETLDEAMSCNALDTSRDKLYQIQKQCTEDFTEAESQEDINRRINNELSNLEFTLVAEEQSLAAILTALYPTIGAEVNDVEGGSDDATCSDGVSSDIPPLLQRYYDRRGDVGIQLERLQELVATHQQTLDTRDFLADRGEQPSTPEDEIQETYEQQRQHILSELSTAEYDVEVLAQACCAAGIDTEARRHRLSMSINKGDSRGQVSLLAPFRSLVGRGPLQFSYPTENFQHDQFYSDRGLSGSQNIHECIQDWLETTETERSHSPKPFEVGDSVM